MKKWEYIREYSQYSGEGYVKWLNKMGQQGWEFCETSAHPYGSNTIFKREIEAGKEIDKSDKETE